MRVAIFVYLSGFRHTIRYRVNYVLFLDIPLCHHSTNGTVENKVLHENTVALPDPMATVLGLRHNAGAPIKLREHDVRGSSERDPGPCNRDATNEQPARRIGLKLINRRLPVR